ncbi:hypothetical protein LZ30DRAFT_785005 [Colletotrichum cereale]|nr:hypothetical protein LZ30DRAFT_785005 [Colletotrichum cereale]
MSGLRYFSYKDHGARLLEMMNYQQAVRVGDRIETAGQGLPKISYKSNLLAQNFKPFARDHYTMGLQVSFT